MGNIFDTDNHEQMPIMANNINSLDKNDAIVNKNLSELYANKDSIETTITQISRNNECRFTIQCNPNKDYHFFLRKDHPNFINLYNNIIVDGTYNIIHEKYDTWGNVRVRNIIDILPCKTHKTTNTIKGFLDVKKEINMSGHHEIVTDNVNNKKRLLITDSDMSNIILGQSYTISYVKAWRGSLYLITKYEICDEIL